MKKKTDISSKPYNRCLQCRHRRVLCDGIRTSSMTLHEWCEYMRDMKEVNDLTNAEISESTGISVKTIEKLLALTYDQDIMRETARRIENAIIGTTNQHPCYLAFEENLPDDVPKLKAALQMLEDAKAKEGHLLEEIERLRKENEYIRVENDRKARVIDKLLDK